MIKFSCKNRILTVLLLFLAPAILIYSQDYIIPLYNGAIPNSKSTEAKEKIVHEDITVISNVQVPDISVYLPTKKNATASGYYLSGRRILDSCLGSEGERLVKYKIGN